VKSSIQEINQETLKIGLLARKAKLERKHPGKKVKDSLLKKEKALKALVWSRGLPATLQIPTIYLFHR